MLVSAVQQRESAICVRIFLPSWISPQSYSIPLVVTEHRAELPVGYSGFPLTHCSTHQGVYLSLLLSQNGSEMRSAGFSAGLGTPCPGMPSYQVDVPGPQLGFGAEKCLWGCRIRQHRRVLFSPHFPYCHVSLVQKSEGGGTGTGECCPDSRDPRAPPQDRPESGFLCRSAQELKLRSTDGESLLWVQPRRFK